MWFFVLSSLYIAFVTFASWLRSGCAPQLRSSTQKVALNLLSTQKLVACKTPLACLVKLSQDQLCVRSPVLSQTYRQGIDAGSHWSTPSFWLLWEPSLAPRVLLGSSNAKWISMSRTNRHGEMNIINFEHTCKTRNDVIISKIWTSQFFFLFRVYRALKSESRNVYLLTYEY